MTAQILKGVYEEHGTFIKSPQERWVIENKTEVIYPFGKKGKM